MNTDEIKINEQESIIEKKDKKLSKIVKILLIVLLTISLICIAIFALYKATVDVADKNVDKFDYVLSENHDVDSLNYKDFIKYDSEVSPNTLSIDISKDYFYKNIIKIDEINAKLTENYNLILNKIGIVSDISSSNTLDFYADCINKNGLNMYITGSLEYSYTENNGIQVYMKKIVIGDGLPMFIYKAFLPINENELIFELEANEYQFLKNGILKLESISNIKFTKTDVKFDFNYMDSVNEIIKYIFGNNSSFISQQAENLMPIILEIVVGDNAEEFMDFAELLLPQFNY